MRMLFAMLSLIIAAEVIEDLTARGYPLFFGALGENLTTRGLTIRDIRIGDQVRAGGAMLEITQPRGPCTQLVVTMAEREDASPECTMFGTLPAYGFYCRHVLGLQLHNIEVRPKRPDFRSALICDAAGRTPRLNGH